MTIRHPNPLTPECCPLCEYAQKNPDYLEWLQRELDEHTARGLVAEAEREPPFQCRNLGEVAPAWLVAQLGLPILRVHNYCLAGEGIEGVVCRCRECHRHCPSADPVTLEV